MKKHLAIGLTLLLIFTSMLTGCKSSPVSSDVSDSKDATEAVSSGGKIELTMWVGPDGLNDYEQSYIDKYNETNEKAYIRTITKPDGPNGEVLAAMMANTAPDILILSYGEVEAFAYADALLPLDTYFEKWDDFNSMNQSMIEQFHINGQRYGLPAGEYAMSMLYNKNLFEEANIAVPKSLTWDEFIELSKKLTIPEKDQYGFALNWGQWGNWWFQMFTWSAGGDLTQAEPDGKLKTTFTDPAVIKAAEFYRKLKAEKCIQSDMSLKLDDLKQDFAVGKAAIIYNGLDNIQSFVSMGMNPDDIGVLPIPTGPGGTNATQLGGSCYVIHAKVPEEKREAVFDYYKLVSSKEYYEGKAEYYKDQGLNLLTGPIRSDINMDLILDGVADDIRDMLEGSSENGRLSFYGSAAIATFIDEAIEKVMMNDGQDVESIFKEYEIEANKQAVPQYNESFQ